MMQCEDYMTYGYHYNKEYDCDYLCRVRSRDDPTNPSVDSSVGCIFEFQDGTHIIINIEEAIANEAFYWVSDETGKQEWESKECEWEYDDCDEDDEDEDDDKDEDEDEDEDEEDEDVCQVRLSSPPRVLPFPNMQDRLIAYESTNDTLVADMKNLRWKMNCVMFYAVFIVFISIAWPYFYANFMR